MPRQYSFSIYFASYKTLNAKQAEAKVSSFIHCGFNFYLIVL